MASKTLAVPAGFNVLKPFPDFEANWRIDSVTLDVLKLPGVLELRYIGGGAMNQSAGFIYHRSLQNLGVTDRLQCFGAICGF